MHSSRCFLFSSFLSSLSLFLPDFISTVKGFLALLGGSEGIQEKYREGEYDTSINTVYFDSCTNLKVISLFYFFIFFGNFRFNRKREVSSDVNLK